MNGYDVEKIMNVAQKFFEEAQKCYENKCYIASLILYGASLEALLLAMCFAYPEKVRNTNTYKSKKRKTKRKRGIFLEFTLKDLIEIAEELKWLPLKEQIENIGEFRNWVKWVQMTRNLVHPASWLKPDRYFGNIHKIMEQASEREYRKFVEISEETVLAIDEILRRIVKKDLSQQLVRYKTK